MMKKEISGSVANFKKEMELIIGGKNSDDESSDHHDDTKIAGIRVSKQLSSVDNNDEQLKTHDDKKLLSN